MLNWAYRVSKPATWAFAARSGSLAEPPAVSAEGKLLALKTIPPPPGCARARVSVTHRHRVGVGAAGYRLGHRYFEGGRIEGVLKPGFGQAAANVHIVDHAGAGVDEAVAAGAQGLDVSIEPRTWLAPGHHRRAHRPLVGEEVPPHRCARHQDRCPLDEAGYRTRSVRTEVRRGRLAPGPPLPFQCRHPWSHSNPPRYMRAGSSPPALLLRPPG